MMRFIFSFIISILFLTSLSATDSYDAEFILHETHESFYSGHTSKGFKQFVREVVVHRKILIHSQHGVETYNRLYIPTYEDLEFRSIVFELLAKTIKSTGEEIPLDKSAIKETTLPGNNPFLRNYEGAVKLVALPQVDVGDIVEYSYKVRYINDYSRDYSDDFKREMIEKIPVRTYLRTIEVDERLKVKLLEFNLPKKHIKEELESSTIYAWNYTDVMPINEEVYWHEYSSIPHVSLLITTYKMNLSKSWEKLISRMDDRPGSNYNFTSEVNLYDLVKLANERATVEDKVRLICDTIYEWRRNVNYDNYRLNRWYRNTKYLTVFKKVGINASLVELRPLSEGPFDEELITFSQFDNSLIEFEDEQGKLHYIMPNEAFVNIDYIPFRYQGSRAVRIRDLLSQAEMEVFTIPYTTSDQRANIEERYLSLSVKDDSLFYDIEINRKMIGRPYYTHDACFVNKSDSALRARASSSLDEGIFNRASIEIFNSDWKGHVVDYYTGELEVSATCQAKEAFNSMQGNIPLWVLVDLEEYDNWLEEGSLRKRRKFDAHVASAYSNNSKLKLSVEQGMEIIINDLMNVNFSNEFGEVQCSTYMEENQVVIDLSIEVKKGFVPNEKWADFIAFDNTLKHLLYLEIPIISGN